MKRISLVLILGIFLVLPLFSQQEARFMAYPDIHGNTVVFTYEGDLWKVNLDGDNGTAMRLTNYPGFEYAAKFSPDGKQIAFTGGYENDHSVYVIPVTGGEPQRLTHNPRGAETIEWTPDGERIVFSSMMQTFIRRDTKLFWVDKTGSAPECLPLDRGVRLSYSPDGNKILYVRRGDEEYYNWKRYRGGQHPDIWKYDFDKKTFEKITDFVGKNSYPMWVGDSMYFVSNRGPKGVSNIYKMNLETKKAEAVTKYTDYDVMMASTDGKTISYIQNGYINLLDTASNQSRKITVKLHSDKWRVRNRYVNPKKYIHYGTIANDGKQVALDARGDVFTLPTDKGQTYNHTKTPGEREMYPQLSPNGKKVAYFSDKSGEYQLYVKDIATGNVTQLTTELKRAVYDLYWSPDGKKILFGNKDFSIFYADVAARAIKLIEHSNMLKNDQFTWKVADYNWSPDSNWICYSIVSENRNNQVFVYSLKQDKKFPVTDDFYDNVNPAFDANGKYLYYLSTRNMDVLMDVYEDNHIFGNPQQVMAVQLQDGLKPPFADDEAAEKSSAPTAVKSKKKGKKAAPAGIRIDFDGIMTRTFPLPVKGGNYFHLKAGNGYVLWSAVDKFTEDEYEDVLEDINGDTKWKIHIFNMKDKKESVIDDVIRNFKVSTNGEYILIRKNSEFYTQSVKDAFNSKKSGKKLNLEGMLYHVDTLAEWNQIFTDAWRWYRDFFWDKNMHGQDWEDVGKRYRQFIPFLSSREELNWLMRNLVGELSVGHAYIFGGDRGDLKLSQSKVFTGLLGADLVADEDGGYYKFKTIYGPTKYNLNIKAPLARPDIKVKEGWYLLAINGKEIKAPEDYFKHLQVLPKQKVKITVNSTPSMKGAKTYSVTPIRYDRHLRYNRWLAHNIDYTLKKSNGRVGYMHVNAMGDGGIAEFDKFWRAFKYKDGLVIDMRRNSGGWTEYFLIDKLERKMVAYNVLTEMKPFRYPNPTSNAKYVVVTNEDNGSDGEAFVEHFKARKLGTVVGMPSWGGLVGIINVQATIDNGGVFQPNNGFYDKNGKWLVENHGADPDIFLDNDPASVMAGKDLQLDKAIQVALEQADKDPFTFPEIPPVPKKK